MTDRREWKRWWWWRGRAGKRKCRFSGISDRPINAVGRNIQPMEGDMVKWQRQLLKWIVSVLSMSQKQIADPNPVSVIKCDRLWRQRWDILCILLRGWVGAASSVKRRAVGRKVIKSESAKNADNTPIWNIKLKETRWSPGSTGHDRPSLKKRRARLLSHFVSSAPFPWHETTRLASCLCQDEWPENHFIRTWPRRREPFILQHSKLWKNKQEYSVPSLYPCEVVFVRGNSLCRRQVVSSFYPGWFTSISIIRHVFIKWTAHPLVHMMR